MIGSTLPSQGRKGGSTPLTRSKFAGIAQWQSSGFVNRRFRVQIPIPAQLFMKKIQTKIILGFFILLLLFYFLFNFGFKIIFSVSSFISNLNHKISPTPNSQKESFIGEINIDSIPQATNSPRILVQGTVVNFDTVSFYLNDRKVKTIDLSEELNFSEELGDLEEGKNIVYALAKNKVYSISKKTPLYEVFYKEKKPKLEIFTPKDGEKINNNEVIIKGQTDKETFVKINEMPVIVDANGNFENSLIIKNEGENKIQITASDIAGNIETKEITVFYQK